MRLHLIIGACFAATFLICSTAAGQTPWGVGPPLSSNSDRIWRGAPSVDAHWNRCLNERDEFPLGAAIQGCTELINAAFDTPSSRAAYLHMRGRLYELTGERELAQADYMSALPLFNDDIERNRSSAWPRVARGLLNYDMENFDAALSDFDRAAELSSRSSSARYHRGRVFFHNGDFAAALAEFDAASRLAANSGETPRAYYRRKCEARAALGVELSGALRWCNRAVRNSRNDPQSLISRGYYWFMVGNLDQAAADFARAAEAAPYRAAAIYGRGVVALRHGRQAEGESDINHALEMDGDEVRYYANAGLAP